MIPGRLAGCMEPDLSLEMMHQSDVFYTEGGIYVADEFSAARLGVLWPAAWSPAAHWVSIGISANGTRTRWQQVKVHYVNRNLNLPPRHIHTADECLLRPTRRQDNTKLQ